MKKNLLSFVLFVVLALLCLNVNAQVKTNFSNTEFILEKGKFNREYKIPVHFEVPAKNINELLDVERNEQRSSSEIKPFKIAVPVSVDLDITKLMEWNYENEFAYGKYTIDLKGALSVSINFDKFKLPVGAEMYIYNKNGNMVTGPITEEENNANNVWGSWVYQGNLLTLEIKVPTGVKDELILHSNNIAYGYKEIYKSIKVGGYGQSGPCNINVICPLGNGWEGERNSVSTVLSANGGEFCTGSLVMNTCNANTPYYLTANHCFNANSNTTGWRFAFQAWSTTCPNPGINTNGVIYNGATLRAKNSPSDFCLVELNQTPPANSGLHYAGWNRSTTPAQSATGIHHPSGDLMKISRANGPVNIASFAGTTNQHWQSNWSPQNNGNGQVVTAITEGGSSGSPLFDQNHRIIGQLHGGPSFCGSSQPWDFYGRFDLSWTGGGTNSTRLSNWLDPNNTGAVTTNTTDIANLIERNLQSIGINGSTEICTSSEVYTLTGNTGNLPVVWSAPGYVQISGSGNSVILTPNPGSHGFMTLTATVGNSNCQTNTVKTLTIHVGTPVVGYSIESYPYQEPTCYEAWGIYSFKNTLAWGASNGGWQWGYRIVGVPGEVLGGQNTPYFTLVPDQAGTYEIFLRPENSCGTGTYESIKTITVTEVCGPGFRSMITTYPNPAKDEVIVTIAREKSNTTQKKTASLQIELVDFIQGTVVRRWTLPSSQSNYRLNLSGVRKGTYLLKITEGGKTFGKTLIIER